VLIVGVCFREGGKIYDFHTNDLTLVPGLAVVVQTANGMAFGHVSTPPRAVPEEETEHYKPVLRLATENDERRMKDIRRRKVEIFDFAQKEIAERKLEMQLVDVEIGFEDNKVTIFFTADNRVDFRELVRKLSSTLRTRIELRQIGARDEARMMGGLGSCGRVLCCASFLTDFQPVSIKMAKDQNLSLSPTKISGLCGRLMCCLKYEQSHYEALRKRMPRMGREVQTPDGPATVIDLSVLTGVVKTKRVGPDGEWSIDEYPVDSLTWQQPNRPPEPNAAPVKTPEA